MGYSRTNHRTMNYYNRKASQSDWVDTIDELVDLIGGEAVQEYLSKYPTAALKIYAAEVKLRELKAKKEKK